MPGACGWLRGSDSFGVLLPAASAGDVTLRRRVRIRETRQNGRKTTRSRSVTAGGSALLDPATSPRSPVSSVRLASPRSHQPSPSASGAPHRAVETMAQRCLNCDGHASVTVGGDTAQATRGSRVLARQPSFPQRPKRCWDRRRADRLWTWRGLAAAAWRGGQL